MKYLLPLTSVLPLIVTTLLSHAADPVEIERRHPTVPMANGVPEKAPKAIAIQRDGINAQMKTMREMHQKMLDTKTPEARNALMSEQMKLMQDSMSMMGGMSAHGQTMGAMGAQGKMMNHMNGDTAARQQMMEERIGMMESMMQMMIDRETSPMAPGTPTK